MTTSGTTTFNLDIAEVIDEAFERVGVEVRTGFELKSARRSLNLLFAEWANRGVNRWTIQQTSVTTVVGQTDYNLGTDTIDILSATLRRDGTDLNMVRLSRAEYLNLPDKDKEGRPSQFYVDRQINPVLKVWFAPDRATDTLIFDRLTRIEDAGAYTNNAAIPFRFYEAMVAGLAAKLALKFNPDRLQALTALYAEAFDLAAAEDRDRASFHVEPYVGYI